MAQRTDCERKTYLVEHYRPGHCAEELRALAGRVRGAAAELEGEGKPVRYLHAAIVPGDESLLCLLEAAGEGIVRETYARAGVPFERLSAVIREGDAAWLAIAPRTQDEPA